MYFVKVVCLYLRKWIKKCFLSSKDNFDKKILTLKTQNSPTWGTWPDVNSQNTAEKKHTWYFWTCDVKSKKRFFFLPGNRQGIYKYVRPTRIFCRSHWFNWRRRWGGWDERRPLWRGLCKNEKGRRRLRYCKL